MNYKKLIICMLSLIVLVSCRTFPGGEPPAAADADPPPGYNPIFVRSVKPFDPNVKEAPQAIVSSVDVKDPNSVKIKVHIIDKNFYFLTGLSDKKYSGFWCEIVDTFQGKTIKLKKPNIYELSERDKRKTYISVVMDHSGSMGEERAVTVQNAIENLIRNKNDEDELALIKYDDRVVTEVPLTASRQQLVSGFRKDGLLDFGGMTAINNGILAGLQEFQGKLKGDEKAVIVFTDGWDNSSTISKDSLIKAARASNTLICGVDFGNDINEDYMKQFADSTGGIYHHIYRTDEFSLVFEDLYNRLKNSYVIEYNPTEYGLHKVRIKLCFPHDTTVAYAEFDNTPDIGSIGLMNVYFDFNKAVITKESVDAVNSVYTLLKAYPGMVIELRGHTDNLNSTSDPDYNLKLSEKRAEAVKDALVKKGITPGRIQTRGFGHSQPVATNDTEEGRAANRRTEFIILEK